MNEGRIPPKAQHDVSRMSNLQRRVQKGRIISPLQAGTHDYKMQPNQLEPLRQSAERRGARMSEHILWKGRSLFSKSFCDRVLNKIPKTIAKQVEDKFEPVHVEGYAQDIL